MSRNTERRHIRRGEIYYVRLGMRQGSIQMGRRPCIVVQNNTGNKNSPTTIIIPITSQDKKPIPTHVDLSSVRELVSGSKAIAEQVLTIDQSELGEYICRLDKWLMAKVNVALMISLGLTHFGEWKRVKSSLQKEKSQNRTINEKNVSYEKK